MQDYIGEADFLQHVGDVWFITRFIVLVVMFVWGFLIYSMLVWIFWDIPERLHPLSVRKQRLFQQADGHKAPRLTK